MMPLICPGANRAGSLAIAALMLIALRASPTIAQKASQAPGQSASAVSLNSILDPLSSRSPYSNFKSRSPFGRESAKSALSEGTQKSRIHRGFGSLPLSFEVNRGQAGAQVKFLSRGSGYSVALMSTEAVFRLRPPRSRAVAASSALSPPHVSVLHMHLQGANPMSIRGEAMLPGKTNYLIGRDPQSWHTDIPTFQRVRVAGVYSGVDLVYYGDQRQLEYDFIVAPKADPGKIALKFDGAKSLKIDKAGDLVVGLAHGSVRWRKPVVYQEIDGARKAVAGRYSVNARGHVAFALGRYDTRRALVIDPVFAYSTYFGGSGDDSATAIALDHDGNAYICGTTTSDDLLGTTDRPGPGMNGFVAKLDPTGTRLLFSTYIGSATGYAIAVDSAGRTYVGGSLPDNTLPVVKGAQTHSSGGASDAFLMEINAAGNNLIYSTYLGGSLDEFISGLALGPDGTVYLAGNTPSTDFPTVSAYQATNGGGLDAFVARIDTRLAGAASLLYSTYLGGAANETVGGIAVDSGGRFYIAGATLSSNFPTFRAFQSAPRGTRWNAFLTRFMPGGSALAYSTYLGGTGTSTTGASSVAVDDLNNAYIAGNTDASDLPVRNAVQPQNGGGFDGFAAQIDCGASGDTSLVTSTYLGGGGQDLATGIKLDVWGNAYVTGYTFEFSWSVFVAKINKGGGNILFGTSFGGADTDFGLAIAVDPLGYAVIAGQTLSADFPVTPGAVQTRLANPLGKTDVFVLRMPTVTKPDFNVDAMPDLLFQNKVTGQIVYWLMQGNQETSAAFLNPSNPGVNWKVAGTADLNGDGNTDLVLQDTNTGDLIYWLMNGTNQTAVRYFTPRNPGTNWNVVGVADINRDGYADIVFQNSVSGDIYVWYMQGTTQIGGAYINPKNPGTGWKVAAVGDLNADGQADLVFQNSTTGNVYVWYMHSDTRIGGGFLAPANPGAGWNVAGLIDFNGDGKPQIIFQNANSGQIAYWIMNGLSMAYFDLPKPNSPGSPNWILVGAK